MPQSREDFLGTPLPLDCKHFTPKLPSFEVGSHEICKYLSPYPIDATYQIWLGLGK